jgi:hemolysin III
MRSAFFNDARSVERPDESGDYKHTMESASLSEPVGLNEVDERAPAIHPETANWITHGLGLCLSLFAAAVLIATAMRTGDAWRVIGCTVYAASLIALYAASTLSHSFEDPARRRFYRMLDQICIFLLVVGTYTPFGMVHAWDGGWWVILFAMWACALTGIAQRVRRPEQTLKPWLFVVIAWLPIFTMGRAWDVSHLPGLALVFAGGAAYMGGIWFLVNDRRHPYFHAAWHVSTILGSALHFLFVLQYVATPAA